MLLDPLARGIEVCAHFIDICHILYYNVIINLENATVLYICAILLLSKLTGKSRESLRNEKQLTHSYINYMQNIYMLISGQCLT